MVDNNEKSSEEYNEEQFKEQLLKIKEKVKDFDELAKFLMSAPFMAFAEKHSKSKRSSSTKDLKKSKSKERKSPLKESQDTKKKEKTATPKKSRTKSNIILDNLNQMDTDRKNVQESERTSYARTRREETVPKETYSSGSKRVLQDNIFKPPSNSSSSSSQNWDGIHRDILHEDDYRRINVKVRK